MNCKRNKNRDDFCAQFAFLSGRQTVILFCIPHQLSMVFCDPQKRRKDKRKVPKWKFRNHSETQRERALDSCCCGCCFLTFTSSFVVVIFFFTFCLAGEIQFFNFHLIVRVGFDGWMESMEKNVSFFSTTAH